MASNLFRRGRHRQPPSSTFIHRSCAQHIVCWTHSASVSILFYVQVHFCGSGSHPVCRIDTAPLIYLKIFINFSFTMVFSRMTQVKYRGNFLKMKAPVGSRCLRA